MTDSTHSTDSTDSTDSHHVTQSGSGGVEIAVGTGGAEGESFGLESFEWPAVLPVLPLKNTVLYPHILSPLLVSTERSQALIDAVLVRPDRMLVAVAVRDPADDRSPGPDDVYRVGTLLRVVKMLKFPDQSYRLLVQGVRRAVIESFDKVEPFLSGRIAPLDDVGDFESVEMTAMVRNVTSQFARLVAESPHLSDELQLLAANLTNPSQLADMVAHHLEFDVSQKQRVLEEKSVTERLKLVLSQIHKQAEALRIETEIKEKVQNDMGRTQRDYMLRQQLEAIRRELGESDEGEEGLELLRARVAEARMPEEAEKQVQRELERLAQTPAAAAEHAVIRTYVDWMADLPWSTLSEDRLDLDEARRVLDEDHYGLEKVKDRIIEFIAVLSLKQDLKGPILCFAGPPGTGKTSLGRSIARALGRKFARVSLGGVRDEAEIRGHRRTYVGALPGRIVQSLRKCGTRNPVFLLDEVDKVGADTRGDPASALLEVLDPEQNSEFSDHYLEVPIDLSHVLFIATANLMDPVPPALRDRMEVIELPGYTLEEKIEIARNFLLPRQARQNGIAALEFELTEGAIRVLCESYTREAGVRNLERQIGTVCRKIALRVAEEGLDGPVSVRPEDLAPLLGPVKFEREIAEGDQAPGVAVGLAWTPAGGDILFIEATAMPGSGELMLTGSLGDVMRESVEAARSWLRAHALDYGIESKQFEELDVHVHVPSGAVQKDGPSAGVGMVTSLTSLFAGRPVAGDLAMTGEITLRGKVLPVGGIKEKLLAAKRAGIRVVVLPERNRQDVEEIPAPLLADLDLRYVGTIDEALQQTLPGIGGARAALPAAAPSA